MAGKSSRSRSRARSKSSEEEGRKVIASNRKARHDFELLAKVEAGLVLRGSEVKSIRENGATIREAYARVEDGDLWLIGAHIPALAQASYQNHEPLRPRKCLVHKRELKKITDGLEQKGLTMVPLSLYFKGVRVKVELALARGRQKGDQRAREKDKSARKEIQNFDRY